MLRLAVTSLLVLSFAVILDSRGADATAISADVYLSQFCAGCALPQMILVNQISIF